MDLEPLLQLGAVGGVLAFVLVRLETRLTENTNAINGLTLQIGVLLDRNMRMTERIVKRMESDPHTP